MTTFTFGPESESAARVRALLPEAVAIAAKTFNIWKVRLQPVLTAAV